MDKKPSGITHLKFMTVWLITLWVVAAINPYSRQDWLLENLLVFVFSGTLIFTHKKFSFSTGSYWLITVFMTLHIIGAHYTYTQTPVGFWAQNSFELSRNHYDRVVHFSFGILLVTCFREILERFVNANRCWINTLSLSIVLSFSALYELVEMLCAMIVNPELGTAFLGTQGDEWDAKKDTGLAFLGAVLAIVIRR